MIYCPNCGTANRDGSRFCNDCGHKLPSKTGIVCPMCSHMNPPANVYCDKCQARLVPAGPTSPPPGPGAPPAPVKKGLSLPTKPAGETEPLPVESETRPESGPEVYPAKSPTEGSGKPSRRVEPEETPEWLHRLRAATPKKPTGALPEPPTEAPPEFPSGEEIPEWMRPAQGEQYDWFDRLAGEPPPLRYEGEPPPSPRDATAEFTLSAVEGEAEGSSAAPALPEASMQAPASGSATGWAQAPESEADLPDWLKELTSPPAAPGGEPAPSEAEGSLDWLAAPTQEPQPDLGEPPGTGEIPDWLTELGQETAPGTRTGGIWKHPSDMEPPRPEEAATPTPGEAWPAALSEPAQPQPGAEELEPPVENWRGWPPSTTFEEPALTGEELAGEADDVPDWLKDLGAGPIGLEPALAQQGEPQEELASEPPDAVSAFAGADMDVTDLAATPDWLTQVQQPASPVQSQQPAPSELPDWLREIGPMPVLSRSPEQGEAEGPPAAWSETPFGEMPSTAGEARGLPPLGDEQLADTRGVTTPAFADEQGRTLDQTVAGADLEAAAIPSWLEALRPVAVTAAVAEGGVTETEGLLAGLQNVLPAVPFIGKPQGAPAVRQAQVPPADIARAELFQRLLSAGALAPTAAKPETAGGQARLRARIVRWVIAVVLVLAVFVPNRDDFMAELGIFQLGSVDPALYAGAAAQVDSLDQGQRVVVSFDYDASQAGEMDPIAEAFLIHIRQRGAQAIAVSLSPSGVALGARVVETLGEKGIPDAGFVQTSFHPGQAVGAQSAIQSAPADLIVVLAGSPEAMRLWIEQATLSGVEAPIVAGASASALPQIQPYLQSEQVDAVVQGLMGGLAYQRSLDPGQDAGEAGFDRLVRSEALYLSQIAFAGILLAGLIVSLAAGRGGRPA